jgi:hypothetical protein
MNTDLANDDTADWNTEIDVIEDYELFYRLDRNERDDWMTE